MEESTNCAPFIHARVDSATGMGSTQDTCEALPS